MCVDNNKWTRVRYFFNKLECITTPESECDINLLKNILNPRRFSFRTHNTAKSQHLSPFFNAVYGIEYQLYSQ